MRHKILVVVLGTMVAASPVSATRPEPTPMAGAPAASATAKYCLRIEAMTGSRLEKVRCWTRQEWTEKGVDVDREWAKEGVAVIS